MFSPLSDELWYTGNSNYRNILKVFWTSHVNFNSKNRFIQISTIYLILFFYYSRFCLFCILFFVIIMLSPYYITIFVKKSFSYTKWFTCPFPKFLYTAFYLAPFLATISMRKIDKLLSLLKIKYHYTKPIGLHQWSFQGRLCWRNLVHWQNSFLPSLHCDWWHHSLCCFRFDNYCDRILFHSHFGIISMIGICNDMNIIGIWN